MDKDIIEVLRNTKNFFSGKPATLEQVEQAQKELGLKFAEDYIKYLLEFGTASFYGTELMGITDDPRCKYMSVVYETLEEKKYDDTVPYNMYVIENLGIDGLLTWQDESGAVYSKMRYDGEIEKLADSLSEYIDMVVAEDAMVD